jgi:CheY-like chemotaxis protein
VVCGEVDNGRNAVEEVTKLLPDVILLDVSIPLLNGLAVARIVRRDHPAVTVVMMSEQDASVLSLVANAAGTAHFVTKSLLAMDLIPLLASLVKAQGNRRAAWSGLGVSWVGRLSPTKSESASGWVMVGHLVFPEMVSTWPQSPCALVKRWSRPKPPSGRQNAAESAYRWMT